SPGLVVLGGVGNAGNPGTPPTLGITRPARHRPSGHKLNRPPMPQGLPPTAHRPTPAWPGGRPAPKRPATCLSTPKHRPENARPSAAFQPAGTAPATSPRQHRERAGRLLKDSFTTGRPRAMWGRRSRLRLEAPRGHGYLAAGCVIIHRGRIFPGIRGRGG